MQLDNNKVRIVTPRPRPGDSQGGELLQLVFGGSADTDEEVDPEDTVNAALEKRMAARKMLRNASYFAFTATPISI